MKSGNLLNKLKKLKQHRIFIALLLGIFCLAVSMLTETVQRVSPNIDRAKKIIENRLHQSEKNAANVLQSNEIFESNGDYSIIKKLIDRQSKDAHIFYYVFKDGKLIYWSSNAFIPSNIDKLSAQEIHFLKEGNGFYEVKHAASKDKQINIYAIIPVYYQYAITNKFLQDGFVWNNPFLKRFIISSKETKRSTSVENAEGDFLFSIRISDSINSIFNPYIVVLEIFGWIILFWSLYQLLKNILHKKRYKLAILLVFIVCLVTDLLLNQFKLFSFTKTSLLFSSNLYASTFLGDSLGTLLIRVFLFSWSLSLLRFIQYDKNVVVNKNWLLVFPVILYYVQVYIIQSVIQNSVISFNFYLINSLERYTFVSLIIFGLGFSSLLFLIKWIFDFSLDKKLIYYAVFFAFTGLGIGFVVGYFSDILFGIFIMLWLITFIIFFYYEKTIFLSNKRYKFLANLILLSFIAFLTSVIIIYSTNKKEIEKRKYRMEELVSDRDIGEEYALTESEKLITNDNFIKTYFKNPYLSTIDLDNRIATKYFKLFQKRYSLNIYAFDKDGLPITGISQKEFYKLNNIRFYKKAKEISDNFYFLSFKENGEKYLGYFPVKDNNQLLGFLFVEFIPKIFSSFSAYPELLLKQKSYYDDELDNFSYAIYDNNYLMKQKGDFEYKVNFAFPVKKNKQFTFSKSENYNHIIYFSEDKQVVLSEKNTPALSTLSVFSYMVIFFLLFFLLIDTMGFSDRFWGEDSVRNFFKGNTLQKQIQNSMIALVLFSLAVIGLVTMVYFQYQYNIYHNGRLLKKVNSVMKDVTQYYIEDFPVYGENTFNKVIQNKIKVLSNIHSLDINVYSTDGELMQSSQPEIFKRNLTSSKMDADAYNNLIIKGKSKFVHDESIGKLSYLSAYQPFRSNGKVLGYFNFPYYGKQKSFQEDISYFLVALVNVYVLFLIAAALLAVFLSRSITNSLTLISDNIKGVQFGKTNTPILWKNDDEIGLLVKQYNLMLAELEKSADLLAKSEREDAWREMAKQVAHEIKNPLTPMKLSIQHLQRALKDNAPDVNELTEKISERLIEQIENLSNIATAFSDFAKMPQGEFRKINIKPVIQSIADLFSENENIDIQTSFPSEELLVKGDKEQLMRLFTNIIKNATQAIPENIKGKIDIEVREKNEFYLIAVKDNGVGIDEVKKQHIFEPNFTTKSSGTGLGLAISRNIIERMNGKIWFDSVKDKYTVFYIQLPKWEND